MKTGHRALRRGRHSEPGRAYRITFVTWRRQWLFEDRALAMKAAAAIEDPCLWRDASLAAWVLMPDHWHGIVEPGTSAPLFRVVQRLKGSVARRVNLSRDAPGPVWAAAYHDHAIRAEEDLAVLARYVIMNPMRAGLAAKPGDYPFWNARWL